VSRRHALILGKLLITVLVIAFLLTKLDMGQVVKLLSGAHPGPFAMAVALLAGSHMVVALVWRFLLDSVGVKVPVERSVRLYFAGLFLNNFFLGSVGGDSYRVFGVYRTTGIGQATLAATLLERITGLVALCLLGTIAVLLEYNDLPGAYRLVLLALTGGSAVIGVAVMLTPGLVEGIARPFLKLAKGRLSERIEGVLEGMRRGGRPGPIALALLVTVSAQAVRIWTHWWCAAALGIDVDPGDLFVAIPVVAVAAGLPISVGGLGVREGSGVLLLAPLGIAEPAAVAMEFLAYLVGVVTSLLGGIAFLLGREVSPSQVEKMETATHSGEQPA
jgi:uncharacterized protein (TIRG00374 family)